MCISWLSCLYSDLDLNTSLSPYESSLGSMANLKEPRIGGPGLVGGLDVFDGMSYKEWLREGEKHLVQRFSPGASYDTIGFFIAKFSVSLKMGQSRDDII